MAQPLALEGLVETKADRDSEELRTLRRENQRLDEELRNLRNELGQTQADKEALERGIRALRQQLSPLHRALRAVFGEIELAIGEDEPITNRVSAPEANGGISPRWIACKNQFPGVPAAIIDALLTQSAMSTPQLATFIKRAYGTTKDAITKLKKAGAVVSDGGMIRLNQ